MFEALQFHQGTGKYTQFFNTTNKMEEKNKQSGRGGKREGAGRKAAGEIRDITLSLRIDRSTDELIKKAATKLNMSRSDIVISSVNKEYKEDF